MLIYKIMGAALSIAEETTIVALLARGDSYDQIRAVMLNEYGRRVENATFLAVKKRNAQNLAMVAAKTMEKVSSDAVALKHQANKTLKKRLDYEEKSVELLNKASQQYLDGEISNEGYLKIVKSVKNVSITELVSVSKEMHAQSGTEPPVQANPEEMAKLAAAIQEGDEVTLSQMVFKRGSNLPPTQ